MFYPVKNQESRNGHSFLSQCLLCCCFSLPVELSVLNSLQVCSIHMFPLHPPGCWLRMGLLKRWNASATLRSPAGSDSGKTLRTAGGSTTQKWPERLPSSPGRTERIPGSAASRTGWWSGTLSMDWFRRGPEKWKKKSLSLSHLNGLGEYWGKWLSCRVSKRKKTCVFAVKTFFSFSPQNLAWKVQCLYFFCFVFFFFCTHSWL